MQQTDAELWKQKKRNEGTSSNLRGVCLSLPVR